MENSIMKLFQNEYREAEEKLLKKGYYLETMDPELFDNEFQVLDGKGKVKIDHLSLGQVIQLSNMI